MKKTDGAAQTRITRKGFDPKGFNLKGLAALAHKALNADTTAYTRSKTLISRFFSGSPGVKDKEAVRLTLIDSLYATNVAAKRYYGITHIADELRSVFPHDAGLKKSAKEWIAGGFEEAHPLYSLFKQKYGLDKSGENRHAAVSLLSKYLYFLTNYSFPIHDDLGAKYHSLFLRTRITGPNGFQKRFRTLKQIREDNDVADFDQLDTFFYLYGKVEKAEFSPLLDRERYVKLARYNASTAAVADVRAGKNQSALGELFGPGLYEFIRETKELFDNANHRTIRPKVCGSRFDSYRITSA